MPSLCLHDQKILALSGRLAPGDLHCCALHAAQALPLQDCQALTARFSWLQSAS